MGKVFKCPSCGKFAREMYIEVEMRDLGIMRSNGDTDMSGDYYDEEITSYECPHCREQFDEEPPTIDVGRKRKV